MDHIRRMRPDDVTALHAVHTLAVRQICAPFLKPAVVEAWLRGRTPEAYQRAAEEEGENFWVAVESDNHIVGFASWRDETLLALFTHPEHQRRGIGRDLFAICEQDALEHGWKIIRLNATLNAKSFYEARGFKRLRMKYRERHNQRIPLVLMERSHSTG